ncbi:hypothetical protein [Bdellovibrio sp. HCB337]|uniref:hypothetical protein n=1 Tax=Bdellovibrio sp. HCB337 TaxID=3394358 RepID=UPI0039A4FCAB
MKWVVVFFLTLFTSWGALAAAPNDYALQVLQKDLPRSLRWFGRMNQAQNLSQVEVYELYRSTLPEAQGNQQQGISVKGSIERMLLLLEGARYFEQIQKAPVEFQNKKEITMRVLQAAKDEMDRFQFGEDPQVLLEEWRSFGLTDFERLSADLVETFTEVQRLLNEPVMVALEQKVDAQSPVEGADEGQSAVEVVGNDVESTESLVAADKKEDGTAPVVAAAPTPVVEVAPAPTPEPTPMNPTEIAFEKQRFTSYIQSAEAGQVAGECKDARTWKTDQAESCQSDDSLECDRSYARQCKKLQ